MPPAVAALAKAARSASARPAKVWEVLGVLIATLTLCVTLGGSAVHREREWAQLKSKVDARDGWSGQLDRIEQKATATEQAVKDLVRELDTERAERRLWLHRERQ